MTNTDMLPPAGEEQVNAKLPDISTEEHIRTLVDSFYERVMQDELIGPVFTDIAKVNWDHHLPNMYDFWSSVLFGSMRYKGRPFPKHIPLPIELEHFQRWLVLFFHTVDSHFSGPKAEEAKQKAHSIASMFHYKMQMTGGPIA